MFPSGDDLKGILERAGQSARTEAKKAGASIYYMMGGKRIRESATGEKFEIIYDENGNRKEIALNE
ncbi:hypothetical protein [Paenibacillus solanacearum]|uniref:hypothetical protein n=1 Tax=Paenibacillus solanacearum TaxID=2048548 RepID=UPI001C406A89|nr:hypothetical protein [Paenibacillus solanacearum]